MQHFDSFSFIFILIDSLRDDKHLIIHLLFGITKVLLFMYVLKINLNYIPSRFNYYYIILKHTLQIEIKISLSFIITALKIENAADSSYKT